MMLNLLAEAVPPDPMISGKWLLTIVPVVASAIALLLGKSHWEKKGAKEARSVTVENQPLQVTSTVPLATKAELESLEARLTTELSKIEGALTSERAVARIANGNLHARIDKSTEQLAEVKGEIKGIAENISRLLDIAMNRKPTTRGQN